MHTGNAPRNRYVRVRTICDELSILTCIYSCSVYILFLCTSKGLFCFWCLSDSARVLCIRPVHPVRSFRFAVFACSQCVAWRARPGACNVMDRTDATTDVHRVRSQSTQSYTIHPHPHELKTNMSKQQQDDNHLALTKPLPAKPAPLQLDRPHVFAPSSGGRHFHLLPPISMVFSPVCFSLSLYDTSFRFPHVR